MSQAKKRADKIKTHILCSITFFSENRAFFYEIRMEASRCAYKRNTFIKLDHLSRKTYPTVVNTICTSHPLRQTI